MSALKKFLELRDNYPYAVQFIEDKWYLIDRGYQKISKGYELSEKKINEISVIANKLQGSYTENRNGKTTGIWFYNDGLRKALEKKGYLEEFTEKIKSIKNLLDNTKI